MNIISHRIRAEREKKGWTQDVLAKAAELSQPMIARYEGGSNVSKTNLGKISKALGLPIDTFTAIESTPSHVGLFDETEFKKRLQDAVRLLPEKHKKLIDQVVLMCLTQTEYEKEMSRVSEIIQQTKKY